MGSHPIEDQTRLCECCAQPGGSCPGCGSIHTPSNAPGRCERCYSQKKKDSTSHRMIAMELRKYGWTVRPPADLRAALGWQPDVRHHRSEKKRGRPTRGRWMRLWEDSTVEASSISEGRRCDECGYESFGTCWHARNTKHECCLDLDCVYSWKVSIIGSRCFSEGWEPTLELAKEAADKALIERLKMSRLSRLREQADKNPLEDPAPSAPLFLPEETP